MPFAEGVWAPGSVWGPLGTRRKQWGLFGAPFAERPGLWARGFPVGLARSTEAQWIQKQMPGVRSSASVLNPRENPRVHSASLWGTCYVTGALQGMGKTGG